MMTEKPVPPHLERSETRFSHLLHAVDPFAPKKEFWASFTNALLATALFRCYHIILFFLGWSTCVTLINVQGTYSLNFQPTLLTVIGTVIGFVISYRTTASFERYNEGRRLWSQIALHSRTFARTVWFHVPDIPTPTPEEESTPKDQLMARTLVEKKTAVNLIEAFSISVKHYLRGEDGIYYEDLWPLVKFLPAYALPPGLPSFLPDIEEEIDLPTEPISPPPPARQGPSASAPHLPLPNVTDLKKRPSNIMINSPISAQSNHRIRRPSLAAGSVSKLPHVAGTTEEPPLLPARIPPKFSYFDFFPLSLLVRFLTKKGKEIKGRKAARIRARRGRKRGFIVSHNVPLEITLYISSYIAALQRRKAIDVPTINLLTQSLNGLVDALTGLERILTTPIPFSYRIHLWLVTTIYCLALPLQIWKTMNWLTIPATTILSFIFFGFLVAGEEIENPFGYDKNDLNMDYFTHSIIRPELIAITSLPTPEPAEWAFSPLNDAIFDAHNLPGDKNTSKIVERAAPDEWVARGTAQIRDALSRGLERTKLADF